MKPFLRLKLDNKDIITLAIGLLSGILVLVLTLNLMATVMVFILVILVLVFQRSYSRGWLVLFAVLLLFPSVKLNQQGTLLNDLLLAGLALIGLIKLAITRFNTPQNNLFYEFFLLALCGFSILSFGFILNEQVNYNVWRITITFLLTWVVLIAFQYYFQTLKRIRRFFVVIFIAGLLHSIFGLLMYIGGWQTSSGMGISNGKIYSVLFGTINQQINGFLGLGLLERLRVNSLAPLLLISITTTVGLFMIARKKRLDLLGQQLPINVESVSGETLKIKDIRSFGIFLKEKMLTFRSLLRSETARNELWFLLAIIIQFVALFFTLTEASVIFLAIGLLAFGILDRNRRLMGISSAVIILFAIIFPSLSSSLAHQSSRNLLDWFDGIDLVSRNWLLGAGWKSEVGAIGVMTENIHNSYLYIWNHFGILGLLILLIMLGKYFKDLYLGYIKSDGEKRIWLMVTLAIFIELVLEAMTGNTLIYGPAALTFWLLYAAAMNLRRKPVIHGLTETKLIDL